MSTEKTPRSKWWEIVIYPDSMPDDWVDIIENTKVPCVLSPEHDKDKFDDGTPKKNHFHMLIKFPSLKTAQQVISTFNIPLGAPHYAEIAHSPYGSYKYLTHENCIDKVKYDSSEIIPFNGFSEQMISEISDLDNYDNLKYILEFVYKNKIKSFSSLVACCLYDDELSPDLFPYIVKNSYFLNSCMRF